MMLSIAVMQFRVVGLVLILSKEFYLNFIIPALIMGISSLLFAFYFYKKTNSTKKEHSDIVSEIKIKSPFEIIPSLKFAALFIIILFAIYFGEKYFGYLGAYVVAFIGSFTDVDAVILSILESFRLADLDPKFVAQIILIAITVNTLVKILYTFILGSREFFKKIIIPISVVSLSGVLFYLIIAFT